MRALEIRHLSSNIIEVYLKYRHSICVPFLGLLPILYFLPLLLPLTY